MNTEQDLNYRLFLHQEEGFVRTTFDSEFEKYQDIRRGNITRVKENFAARRANFEEGKGQLSPNPIRNLKYHLIISTAITARICVQGGMNHDVAYTLSDIYIQRADATNDYNELMNLYETMQLDFALRMSVSAEPSNLSPQIKKCVNYIYDHLHEKITIDTLAKLVNRDPTYLSKLFHKEVHHPIHSFVLNARIMVAKNILKDSDFSYADIANALNFCSQSAFISVFKKHVGMTPKEFRNFSHNNTL